MNLTIQELQRQITRGPGLVFGPQLSTSGAMEPECLTMLRKMFPNYDNDKPVASYLDYADLILAKGEVAEVEARRIADSLEAANKMMIAPGVRHSKDVLCSLWYLLPQTHGAIEDSLVNEYRHLGETEQAVRHFADAAASKSVAKSAYEFVTTTSGFDGAALPVEVLITALEISYSQWGQQCTERKPLWGLLYWQGWQAKVGSIWCSSNYFTQSFCLCSAFWRKQVDKFQQFRSFRGTETFYFFQIHQNDRQCFFNNSWASFPNSALSMI